MLSTVGPDNSRQHVTAAAASAIPPARLRARSRFRRRSGLPGFGLTFGFTGLYLSLIVLIPMSAVVVKTAAFASSVAGTWCRSATR